MFLVINCPRCRSLRRVPIGAVLLATGAEHHDGQEADHRLAFICDSCGELGDTAVSAVTAERLSAAGCAPIAVCA
jgi:hypothetical protein